MDVEGNTPQKCTFQLRRVGASATCKGVKDSYRLQKHKMLIGRHLSMVDIYLNSSVNKKMISRQHAELWIECHHDSQVIYLLDKSTNGTFVNDIKIVGKVRLTEGDTLTFGHTQGIRIQPGMLKKQPESEFRFVLEKVFSENSPPHSVSILTPERHSLSAYRHQHTPEVEALGEHSAHLNDEEETVTGQECFQSLPCTTNVRLSPSVCQLPPKICPPDLNQFKCKLQDDTGAALTAEHLTTCHQQGPTHQKTTVEFREEVEKAKLHSTQTDKEILELTSIISAKAARSDSSDSDRDLRGLSPLFSMTKHLPSPWKRRDETLSENSGCEGSSLPHVGHLITTPTSQQSIEVKCRKQGGHAVTNKKKRRRRQGYPRTFYKSKSGGEYVSAGQDMEAEACDSFDCCKPTDRTVDWVQCDGCDKWYHVACVGCDYDTVKKDSAAFHCGCTHGL